MVLKSQKRRDLLDRHGILRRSWTSAGDTFPLQPISRTKKARIDKHPGKNENRELTPKLARSTGFPKRENGPIRPFEGGSRGPTHDVLQQAQKSGIMGGCSATSCVGLGRHDANTLSSPIHAEPLSTACFNGATYWGVAWTLFILSLFSFFCIRTIVSVWSLSGMGLAVFGGLAFSFALYTVGYSSD